MPLFHFKQTKIMLLVLGVYVYICLCLRSSCSGLYCLLLVWLRIPWIPGYSKISPPIPGNKKNWENKTLNYEGRDTINKVHIKWFS